jgi:DNA repair exonuclease SbcCD ATPase subunit
MRFFSLIFLFAIFAIAQNVQNAAFEVQRAELMAEKLRIEDDINRINAQIILTDSIATAERRFASEQQARQRADLERRKSEIEDLRQKLSELSAEVRRERALIANSQVQIENTEAERKALVLQIATHCRKLEGVIRTGLPWDTESRVERVSVLCQDLESANASAEEGFSRLRAVYAEEIRFGDEVQISNRAIVRNNGEIVNANVLRIGNQWVVYQDDAGIFFGVLNRRINENGDYEYKWKEDLSFEERQAVRTAIDVKLSRKPPQMVKLPLSLSIEH